LVSVLLASCSSSGDPNLGLGTSGYNSAAMVAPSPDTVAAVPADTAGKPAGAAATSAKGQGALPGVNPAAAGGAKQAGVAQAGVVPAAQPKAEAAAAKPAQSGEGEESAEATAGKPAAAPQEKAGDGKAQVIATAAEWPVQEKPAPKRGFLASFFGSTPATAAPAPAVQQTASIAAQAPKPSSQTFIENRPAVRAEKPAARAKPEAAERRKPVVLASYGGEDSNGLPGVRTSALFEIKRRSGLDDDSDIDVHEDVGGSVMLASAAGMARLAPNGLLKQTERVDVACLKPSLVRVLKTIERRFGKKLVVTSGYRSRAYNMEVRGAKNSQHMYCAAADIQVPGVSKWDLANFVRAMPGRGGVGTYCHTNSVHVDIGPERDWNWRCRRSG